MMKRTKYYARKAKKSPLPGPRKPKPASSSEKVEIDWEQFDKLCEIQATHEEIAGWFNCNRETIRHKVKKKYGVSFSDYYRMKRAPGRVSLRRRQYQSAVVEGNPAMLIWLGKQYLYQADKKEITGADGEGIRIIVRDET